MIFHYGRASFPLRQCVEAFSAICARISGIAMEIVSAPIDGKS